METKAKILKTAGALFARNGRDGVGIRGIAEQSGVSVNTVMYHFTSKDNLYREVVLARISEEIPFEEIFAPMRGSGPVSPRQAADGIALIIRNLFDMFFRKERKEQADFLVQAILSCDQNIGRSLMQAFSGFELPLLAFLDRAGVRYDKHTIMFISYVLWSQLLFINSAKEAVMADLGVTELPQEYYYDVARRITEVFAQQLGLPEHDKGVWAT